MSFEKIVKLACKPKAAPPKAKYLDPIIAATYSDDGAIGDVCRALSGRLREPNATVVFKALIVLHTMIRTGNTDNVLGYLSASDILRLQNVAGSHWEGYSAPENLGQYARYLQIRIKTFRELKHDPVRVQSDSNRDHRVGNFDNDRDFGGGNGAGVSRSKTIVGRKLRVMSVEKGLLRETRLVQAVVDALTGTKFYVDNLEEELNVVALRMLVKDLLILFQAVNEGIINLLEHYFEMSHVDAKEALDLYRRFCRQTEAVVEYLSIAKKLQNLLNVSIPNLKHAPVSLVNSLEEYLNDPNFEDNRLEYKANKAAADGKAAPRQKGILKTPSSPSTPEKPSSSSTPTTSAPSKAQNVADFFASIEQEQGTIFNPNTGSPTSNYFQQQATINPFALQQSGGLLPQQTGALAFQQPQVTGFPGQPAGGAFLAPQTTGFPQASAASAFFAQAQAQPQPQPQLAGLGQAAFLAPQPQQSSGFLQPQPTGFLQPQTTGSNPFRQSMLMPQASGLPAFGAPVASTSPAPMSNFNPF
ncbi:ANTH-domain-containing protein, partial [Clavulina sp. PMI_390]